MRVNCALNACRLADSNSYWEQTNATISQTTAQTANFSKSLLNTAIAINQRSLLKVN